MRAALHYCPRRHLAALFGLQLVSDIPERLCDAGVRPPLDSKRRRRLARIRAAGTLFIHVPKTAGMSVSRALYGEQIKHATIRYYMAVASSLVDGLPSFAVVRDPVERFRSAYAYAKAGGSPDNRVSAPFRGDYMAFRSVDEALDHIEAADCPYTLDHIFRPQSWYVTDRMGRVAVKQLLSFDQLAFTKAFAPHSRIEQINASQAAKPPMTRIQVERLRRLYAADFHIYRSAATEPSPKPW